MASIEDKNADASSQPSSEIGSVLTPLPPALPLPSNHIQIKVAFQNGNELHFKLKTTTTLDKVMASVYAKYAVDPASVRFLYDGQRVKGSDTPASLKMEENDVIDALLSQTGGHSVNTNK